jgi:hypothetical protein
MEVLRSDELHNVNLLLLYPKDLGILPSMEVLRSDELHNVNLLLLYPKDLGTWCSQT